MLAHACRRVHLHLWMCVWWNLIERNTRGTLDSYFLHFSPWIESRWDADDDDGGFSSTKQQRQGLRHATANDDGDDDDDDEGEETGIIKYLRGPTVLVELSPRRLTTPASHATAPLSALRSL